MTSLSRPLAALALLATLAGRVTHAEEPQGLSPAIGAASAGAPVTQVAPAPVPIAATSPAGARSFVYTITDREAEQAYETNAEIEGRMVDRLILSLTGQGDLGHAWGKLVQPSDRVGIKVATTGGQVFSTHRGIVTAIVRGLEAAGVPRGNVVVWDRQIENLRAAGYVETRSGYAVRGIDPPKGFDREAKFVAPMLGVLIWGDLSFNAKPVSFLRSSGGTPDVSSESHFPRLLTKEITRIVNVPTFSDERGCGVAGAMYNVTVPVVDNYRRFTQGSGSSSICDLYADARIGPKVAITIVDGLLAQYAGGPDFNPNYLVHHHTLYASRDPVALDATLLPKLEAWRKQANLPPIGERAAWIREAQTIGLGNYDADKITVVPVAPGS